MSHSSTDGYPLAVKEPTSTSILEWIKHIDTPPSTSSTSPCSSSAQPCQTVPATRHTKRRRHSDSPPSEYYCDKRLLWKTRRPSQATAASMSPPFTPSSKSSPASSADPYTLASNNTPSESMADLNDLKNADTAGLMMQTMHLMHNDRVAFNRYPVFKNKVLSIIGASRGSPMRAESHKKFKRYLNCYEFHNKATFLRKIFPLLMKDGYHLKAEREFTDAERQQFEKREYLEYRDFLMEEGIVDTADCEFFKTLVPSLCNKDSKIKIAKQLAKVTGMTNPKPDYTFGIRRGKFPPLTNDTMPEYIAALLGIAPEVYHAFLIIEVIPDTGSHAEAQNQARQGGATLVHAERKLRGLVEKSIDVEGPDEESFMFSVTLSPLVAEFWVHWYEGKGPKQPGYFHMSGIGLLALGNEAHRETIRRKLHNIMEWGGMSGARFNMKLQLHESIHAFVRKQRALWDIHEQLPCGQSPSTVPLATAGRAFVWRIRNITPAYHNRI